MKPGRLVVLAGVAGLLWLWLRSRQAPPPAPPEFWPPLPTPPSGSPNEPPPLYFP